MPANISNIIVAVDIGSTKVCTVVVEVMEEELNVIGVSTVPNNGVIKGAIADIATTAEAIEKSIKKAEELAGVRIEGVITSISGKSISGIVGHGMTSLSRSKQKLITEDDIEMALESTTTLSLSPDREILHIKPIQYIVDAQDEIKNPLGMTGMKLEVDTYIITGSTTAIENVKRVIEKAGYRVVDIIAQPLASAKAILYQDEMDIGVLMLDIGGGTTNIALYHKDALKFVKVIPVGGQFITGDIAMGLHISKVAAEKIKAEKGLIYPEDAGENEYIDVPDISGEKTEKIHRRELIQFIVPRVKELLDFVETELRKEGIDKSMYAGGVVVTGGTALLKGLDRLIKERFNTRCRIGLPLKEKIVGLYDIISSPEYSSAIGLIDYYITEQGFTNYLLQKKGLYEKVLFYIKKFFSDFF